MKVLRKAGGILLALILLGGVMAYLAGVFEPKITGDGASRKAAESSGETFQVQCREEPLVEQAAGTLRAKVETVISPLITATIVSISVRAGDQVKEGDVLVELDSRELNARLDQAHQTVMAAKARLQDAENDYERAQRILKADPGAIAKAEVDQAEVAVRTARAELERARRQEDEARTALSYSTLRAPISGRIVDRYGDPGDTARQGEPILRMYDPLSLRLEANVRESVASTLSKDTPLTVRVDALERDFPAAVDEIVPSADPGSRSFLVKASLPSDPNLYPGMFGRLLIPVGMVERIYVPARAVTEVGQLTFLLVKTEQGPQRRYVRLGRSKEDRVEVISGIAPGEIVWVPEEK